MPKYDLAISFAGEQRRLARAFAERLDASGYAIFFDEFYEAELWAADLTVALADIYALHARWCLVLVSADYLKKPWTNIERQNALYRFMQEKHGYLLCLYLDDSKLPGLPPTIGYIDFRGKTEEHVFQLLLQKLGPPSHDDFMSALSPSDRDSARHLVEACYRRAIFTRMDSEIDMRSMYGSISAAIGRVQSLIPQMEDQSLQFVALQIVRALDDIERVRVASNVGVSNHLPTPLRKRIDAQKRRVVRLLLEIRRAAALPIQLPMSLQVDHFFGREAADQPPHVHL